jgi:hypothetical protein
VGKVFCIVFFFTSPPTGFVGENKHTVEQETPEYAQADTSTSGSGQYGGHKWHMELPCVLNLRWEIRLIVYLT